MKRVVLVVFTIIMVVVGVRFFNKKEMKILHFSHYIDTTAQRLTQIEKCGSCHKEVYENWKKGPHSNSYLTLKKHNKYIDSSENFPEGYNKYIEGKMESVCMACHTGKNLYETNFRDIDHNALANHLNKDSMPEVFEQATSRNIHDTEQLTSGVDCITCHVEKDQVVTNADSKSPNSLGLIKSNFFSGNMNCFSCHHHQVTTMNELVEKKVIPSEINCVSCHQEYNNKGKGTHYFYWRNDHISKKRPEHLVIFNCVKIKVENKKVLKFDWTNTLMPHGYSECGDAKAVIVAVYNNGKQKVILEQTINRKDFFDARPEMPPHFHVGKNGNNFEYKVPILKSIDLDDFSSINHFIILGYVKPQYWSDEKEFTEVYKKDVSLTDL